MRTYYDLLALTDDELAKVDPALMNLLVAKSIPSLAGIDIPPYLALLDEWAAGVKERLPQAEAGFWRRPEGWKNDINLRRLVALAEYLDKQAGVAYIEEQKYVKAIQYTNPSDMFLNGLLDTRRGTCGSMSTLFVALAWRLGWPVSLACAKAHIIARYDDGTTVYNLETTNIGRGLSVPSDEHIIKERGLPPKALSCGSDLRTLTRREMLGLFLGARARHMRDSGNVAEAELSYLLARHLFPRSREFYTNGTWIAVERSTELFGWDENIGHPLNLAENLVTHYGSRYHRPPVAPTMTLPLGVTDPGYIIRL